MSHMSVVDQLTSFIGSDAWKSMISADMWHWTLVFSLAYVFVAAILRTSLLGVVVSNPISSHFDV